MAKKDQEVTSSDESSNEDESTPLTDAQLRRLVAKACKAQEKTVKATKKFQAALAESTQKCLNEIEVVKADLNSKVDGLGDEIKRLRAEQKDFQNRTVQAPKNISSDLAEWERCRRIAMISPISYDEAETNQSLVGLVRQFFLDNMKIPKCELDLLKPFTVTRPLSQKFSRQESPVEVLFGRVEDRDFCFGRLRPLVEQKGKSGRFFAKYPRFLSAKRQALEAEAESIRRKGQYWAQVRFSDTPELITIYVRDQKNGGPWMPKDVAFKQWNVPAGSGAGRRGNIE